MTAADVIEDLIADLTADHHPDVVDRATSDRAEAAWMAAIARAEALAAADCHPRYVKSEPKLGMRGVWWWAVIEENSKRIKASGWAFTKNRAYLRSTGALDELVRYDLHVARKAGTS